MSSPEMLTKVKSFLNKSGNTELVDGVTFVSDYTVEKGILNFASQNEIDAIAVATHGRTGISHFLSGSITEDIANHSTKPVITFRIES